MDPVTRTLRFPECQTDSISGLPGMLLAMRRFSSERNDYTRLQHGCTFRNETEWQGSMKLGGDPEQ